MKTRLIQIAWLVLTLASLGLLGTVLYWFYSYFQILPAKQSQALADAGIPVGVFFGLNILFILLIYFSFFIVAQLIMLRRARESFSLLAAVVLLAFGTGNIGAPLPGLFETYFTTPSLPIFVYYAFTILGWTLIDAFLLSYPDGRFFPRWTLVIAVLGFVISAFWTTNPSTFSTIQGIWAVLLLVVVTIGYGGTIYAQIWRYRHYYSPLQRQQVKWFVPGIFGILISVLPSIFVYPRILDPNLPTNELVSAELLYMLGSSALAILPITVGIAILRYRLWDIDIIIRKTLTYALVAALLALVYFGSIVLLQRIFASMTGQTDQIITVVSTLAIAALFIPVRNRIQAIIDQRFYRKKYDAQQVLADFANTVRDETDLEQLTGRLVHVVNETMQPKSVSVWLKKEN